MSVASQSAAVPAKPEPQGEPEVILVVEDDGSLSKLIQKQLATVGHQTVGVHSGQAALDWLKQDSPSLMLLDYSLPDMRGEQLIERIQSQGRRVPFVVATGHGSESVAVEMMRRGAYDYLVKDATFLKLLPLVVERALDRVRQAQRLIQAEEQLREAHAELELRVQRRTAELAEANFRLRVEMDERRRAEEQLQQHQAELAHVARLSTVGEMVVELTHELNQPLSAISSYAQACRWLLQPEELDRKELLASLNQVGEQADRAAEIIRRLRRFVTKTKPTQSLIDMNGLVQDVAKLTKIDARTAATAVQFELTSPLPLVAGDRIQIEQVVVNLMRNAFEAMAGRPPLSRQLVLRTAIDSGQNVRVEVCDSGSGIAPTVIDHVFDRFYTTKPNGMGMGLAISQSIVERHGGTLWVTPNAEQGTTFHFTLPIDFGEQDSGS
ncbi:MAG: response regulator [Planctomycetaceae bacterium]|nr:response regulator [Planctomycetaceae bacterium]